MPSKRFSFIADSENWQPFGADSGAPAHNMYWRPYHVLGQGERKKFPARPTWIVNWETERGGTLRSTSALTSPVLAYWEWTGTWADLGATGNVKSISAQYIWRYLLNSRRAQTTLPEAVGSGPLSLVTQQGTVDLIAPSFVPAEYQMKNYPQGPIAYDGPYVQTDPPVGWKVETGQAVALSGQRPNSPVILRLWHRIQAMPVQDPGFMQIASMRITQDEVVLTWEEGGGALWPAVGRRFPIGKGIGIGIGAK